MFQSAPASWRVWIPLLASLLCTAPGLAQDPSQKAPDPVFNEADLEAIRWFDGLGFPTAAGKPFVKVNGAFGNCAQCPGRGRRMQWRFGFLLEETPTSFTVVHDLWPVEYSKGNNAGGPAGATFEKVDFHKEAVGKLGQRGFRPNAVTWSNLVRNRARPSQNLSLFLLGRSALQLGLKKEAAELLNEARQRRPLRWRNRSFRQRGKVPVRPTPRASRPQDEVPLRDMLNRELSKLLFWSAVDACGEFGIPRATMRERFRAVGQHFPKSRERKAADSYVETLTRMVEEEAAAMEPTQPKVTELGDTLVELQEPLDELVFRLRDLHAGHEVYHNSVTLHLLAKDTASQELFELGPIAIPTLLKLGNDDRMTRIVNLYPRRGNMTGYVLRYSDVALELLSKLSGRRFTTMERATDWWVRVEARGREVVLEEMILEGRSDARELAGLLLEVDRDRAIAAAMAAARGRKGRDRERLVSFVAAQSTAAANAFLLEEVRGGPDLHSRMTAARTLHRRGFEGWGEPLVSELGRLVRARTVRNARTTRDVIRFVVASGTVRSLEQLRRLYAYLSHEEKRNLLESVAGLPRDHSDRSAIGEATLAGALTDASQLPKSWAWQNVRTNAPQMAEIAAVMLAKRLDTKFDLAAPPFERRRRMVEIGNQWRGLRGLPLERLPLPPAAPEQADPELLQAAEVALVAASWPEEVEAALETYEELGLSGLVSLRRVIREGGMQTETAHAARRLLEDLASTVSEIRVTDEASVLTEEDLASFQPLVGAPLRAQELIALLKEHVEKRRAAVLELNMHRDGGGRGISLEVTMRPTVVRRSSSRVTYSLRVGKVFNQGSYYVNLRSKTTWSRFESRLTKLLDGDVSLDGELRLRVTGRR